MRGSSSRLTRGLLLVGLLAATAPQAAEEEFPALELLDYLGQWEREDGSWSDPMEDYDPQQAEDARPTEPQPDAPNGGSER